MAVLQATSITGGLTMHGMAAGFVKLNASGAVTIDTNTYATESSLSSYLPLSGGTINGNLTMSGAGNSTSIIFGEGTKRINVEGYWMMFKGHENEGFRWQTAGQDNVTYTTRMQLTSSALTVNGNIVLHAGNYNSYAPTLTGGSASGTWGINVTGTAGSETLNTVAGRNNSTTRTLISTNTLGLYVNSGGASYIGINSTSSWAYTSLLNNGSTIWDLGAFNGGNFEFRPYGGDGNRIIVGLNGVMYFTDTTNGIYKSGGRFTVRSESTDNVANFANYGLYLPVTGQTAGLYVESPIEARGGLRMGSGAGNGTITVGADTAASANRLVQRDGGGDIYSRYSFAVHFNASSPNNENPSIAAIWTNSAADNYLRKSTPAHLISQLGLVTGGPYLPLSGGTVTGDTTFGNNSQTDQGIRINYGNYSSGYGRIRFLQDGSNHSTIHSFSASWQSGSLAGHSTGAINISGQNGVTFGDWNNVDMWTDRSGNMQVRGSMRAPIFYDSQNTAFYLDPNTTGTSLRIAGGIAQDNIVGRPAAYWGSTGTTGAVVIKFPGGTGNYGMVHAVIDIYEYDGNAAATVIVGGHNWGGAWYNINAEVIGQTNKPVRVGVKDGRYCIVIGNGSSSWSYGQVVLRKIQNGTYYSGVMDVAGGYSVAIESDSYSWISGDLRNLRTPLSFTAGSTISAGGDVRAPIFYDSNDTGYYLDLNSESNLWKFTFGTMSRNGMNPLSVNSPWSTRASQAGPYQNGTMGWGQVDLNTIGSYWGSGFIDSWSNPGNAPGGSSHYVGMQGMHHNDQNGNFHGWQMVCAQEATNRWFWRSSWNVPNRPWVEMIHSGNIGSQSVNYATTAGSLSNMNISQFTNNSGYVTSSGSVSYATTSYIVNSTNDFRHINRSPNDWQGLANSWHFNDRDTVGMSGSDYWVSILTVNPWYSYDASHRQNQLGFGGSAGLYHRFATSGSSWSGWSRIYSDAYRPYTDSAGNADTTDGYHLNQDVTIGASPTWTTGNFRGSVNVGTWGNSSDIIMHDGDEGNRVLHCNSNRIGFLNQSGNWGSYCDDSGNWFSDYSVRAPIFYDSGDTTYYLDPNAGSVLNTVRSLFLANYYDVATDHNYGIYFASGLSSLYGIFREGGAWNWPYPDLRIAFHTGIKIGANAGYQGIRFYSDADMATIVASINDGDNNMRGYYDIIAYASDRRLKHNVKPIENALSKVISLTGMTYEWNDVGKTYGWEPVKGREAGVFAQEVQEVLPEAVRLAPFDQSHDEEGNMFSKSGENFLTVKYEKLVPLLIEAIKEQQKQIEELKAKLN